MADDFEMMLGSKKNIEEPMPESQSEMIKKFEATIHKLEGEKRELEESNRQMHLKCSGAEDNPNVFAAQMGAPLDDEDAKIRELNADNTELRGNITVLQDHLRRANKYKRVSF
jgi:predicted RNase H-like nuclease (RuvC/YqgF family)